MAAADSAPKLEAQSTARRLWGKSVILNVDGGLDYAEKGAGWWELFLDLLLVSFFANRHVNTHRCAVIP